MIGLGLAVLAAFSAPACAAAGPQPELAARKPKCPARSAVDILDVYGRVWGDVSEQRGIGSAESATILKALESYYACAAVESNEPALCDQLESKISPHHSSCRNDMGRWKAKREDIERQELADSMRTITFNFIKFMAGAGEPGACHVAYQAFPQKAKSYGDEDSFCMIARASAQKGGLQSFCADLVRLKKLSPAKEASCRRDMPAQMSDCGGDKDCREIAALYQALKSGQMARCPSAYMHLCRGRPKPSAASSAADRCAALEKNAIRNYCKLFSAAFERSGGSVGVTDADVKNMTELNRRMRSDQESAH